MWRRRVAVSAEADVRWFLIGDSGDYKLLGKCAFCFLTHPLSLSEFFLHYFVCFNFMLCLEPPPPLQPLPPTLTLFLLRYSWMNMVSIIIEHLYYLCLSLLSFAENARLCLVHCQ